MKIKLIFYVILLIILESCDGPGPTIELVYKNNTNYTITILAIRKSDIKLYDTGKLTIMPFSSIELIYSVGYGSEPLRSKGCIDFSYNCSIAYYDSLKVIFDNTKVQKCFKSERYNPAYDNTICNNLYSNYTFTQRDYDSAEFIKP